MLLPAGPSSALLTARIVLIGLLLCTASFRGRGVVRAYASGSQGHEKPYALIFGTVWGPNDIPLFGVRVKLRRDGDKKPKWEQYSNHQGEFAFRVPAGKATYYLMPDLKGYKLPNGNKLQAPEEVKVEVENDERVDTGLHLK